MNLPTEILQYFYIDINDKSPSNRIKTLDDFISQEKYLTTINMLEVFKIVNKFKLDGYLISGGYNSDIANKLSSEYLVSLNYDQNVANYGTYNFLFYGFGYIASYFSQTVKPIIVTKMDGSIDIGTGFFLGNKSTFITARHVIDQKKLIEIPLSSGKYASVLDVTYPKDPKVDIALITVLNCMEDKFQAFNAKDAEILEEVMTIGYPPIPGFDAIQIFESMTVNNSFKFSKGKILNQSSSYLNGNEYLIINAKVKGGNSGCPVINTKGNIVGIVSEIPINSEDSSKIDSLGYGIVTPKSEIIKLLRAPNHEPAVIKLEVKRTGNGFTIVN